MADPRRDRAGNGPRASSCRDRRDLSRRRPGGELRVPRPTASRRRASVADPDRRIPARAGGCGRPAGRGCRCCPRRVSVAGSWPGAVPRTTGSRRLAAARPRGRGHPRRAGLRGRRRARERGSRADLGWSRPVRGLARPPSPPLRRIAIAVGTDAALGAWLVVSWALLRVLWTPIGRQADDGALLTPASAALLVGFVAIWLCLVAGGGVLHAWSSTWWSLEDPPGIG